MKGSSRFSRFANCTNVTVISRKSSCKIFAPTTIPMHAHPDTTRDDMLKTIALARLILGGEMNVQAPPNLTPDGYELYLRAGINDWGGVSPLTPDFINPEAPWPALRMLREKSALAGVELKARLPHYPEYI